MKSNVLSSIFLGFLLLAVGVTSSCKKDSEPTGFGTVTVEFDHEANGATFALGTNYTNANGDVMNFSKFNYYVSNFSLEKADGTIFTVPKDSCYFLIKANDATTHEVTLANVPAGDYVKVNFIIGVDSLKSVAPVSERTGVLDPAGEGADMYWMWNSGYIFVKAEGTSPQAPLDVATGTNPFYYHIGLFGGYSSPTLNNIKKVSLAEAEGDAATVRTDISPNFHLKVDVMEMFKAPTTVSVAANPEVMVNPYSATIAANYADMFRIEHIHN